MCGGAVSGRCLHGRPPDGAHCSRRAGLHQCKSFVELCILSCLSALTACVCGLGAVTLGCPRCCSPCSRDSPTPLYLHQVAGCRLVGCRIKDIIIIIRSSADCLFTVTLWRGCCSRSSSAWGQFLPLVPRSRLLPPLPPGGGWVWFPLRGGVSAEYDLIGVFSGEEGGGGVRSGPGEARSILLLHIMGARPSKQPLMVRTFLKVYMEFNPFFFLSRSGDDALMMMPFICSCRNTGS